MTMVSDKATHEEEAGRLGGRLQGGRERGLQQEGTQRCRVSEQGGMGMSCSREGGV